MTPQARAGGVLLGKVTVEYEGPLWAPTMVFVTCSGVPQYATQTDRKGNFLITTTKVQGALSLQADAKRQMETYFEGCSVQASLAGFHSSEILITHRNLRDDPELGTLTLKRNETATGTALSETTAPAPANALKSFLKARSDLLEQQPDRAQRDLQKAVDIYPAFAEAWYQLGRLQQTSSREDARNSFSKALAFDPQFIPPYQQLAGLAVEDGKWSEVLANTNHALQLDPAGTPQIWFYDALANFQLGKTNMAEASALKSLTMDPSHSVPNTEQLLAVILARRRDYAGAIAHLRNCLTYLPSGPSSNLVKEQIAQLEESSGAKK
jgi:tetratricopeptide (TPR) repeat protein